MCNRYQKSSPNTAYVNKKFIKLGVVGPLFVCKILDNITEFLPKNLNSCAPGLEFHCVGNHFLDEKRAGNT